MPEQEHGRASTPETLETLVAREEIRTLLATYARGADRRDAVLEASVFTEDGVVVLYDGDPSSHDPVDTIHGRERLAETFGGLIAQYEVTTYLNGQSTIRFTGPDTAEGETYCVAFHVLHDGDERVLLTMSIRYLDRFVRADGAWAIAHRDLVFDWTDRSPSHT
ncbi:nuclear transport factor 2 family protein [Curtobacterium sp. MCLR17_043]|uniref:nuclear transport factor 2 family protein n=1 Tax=Curtobacterium sp. MCLR17_043 TaxID=2175627 RepID=UPI000D854DD1|nr:nuclear transport factor 2 family protein [Curtobacterium sp. MCLR17_043]PYY44204.1 nuclear transport factor 2 family protein [Curtobacterium sp. MCLR17_043]